MLEFNYEQSMDDPKPNILTFHLASYIKLKDSFVKQNHSSNQIDPFNSDFLGLNELESIKEFGAYVQDLDQVEEREYMLSKSSQILSFMNSELILEKKQLKHSRDIQHLNSSTSINYYRSSLKENSIIIEEKQDDYKQNVRRQIKRLYPILKSPESLKQQKADYKVRFLIPSLANSYQNLSYKQMKNNI